MNLIEFEELYSTNAYAKDNFDNLNNFDVVSTNLQTSGHGQFERVEHVYSKAEELGIDSFNPIKIDSL
mgnify:CR=1 FL=1